MVSSSSKQQWFAQYAKLVITLERGHSPKQLARFQKIYTTPITAYMRDSRYGLGMFAIL